jgi:hypothetical protein
LGITTVETLLVSELAMIILHWVSEKIQVSVL